MRRLAVLACLAACGRLGFGDDTTGGDGGVTGDAVDAAITTGPKGPRWIVKFDGAGANVAGRNGEILVLARFTTTFTADPNITLTGNAFISTALLRYDAVGAPTAMTVLDSNGFCEMRAAIFDGEDAYLAGFTIGTQTIPAYGACSIATNRQDPIAIRIDAQGNQTLVAHWIASGANAQGWNVAVMPDHTLTLSGIYGGALQIGTFTMPTAMSDPSAFVARSGPTVSDAAWASGFTAGFEIHGGPLAASGDDVCVIGAYRGNATIFGQALPYVGGYDAWIARLDGAGTARWVRGIGSTADEPSYDGGSIVALADGGCLAGIHSNADISLDSGTYSASLGTGLVVRFDSSGTVVWARRYPSPAYVATIGNRRFAAFAQGGDARIVEIDETGTDIDLGVVGGAGTQTPVELVAVGPDALAVTLNTMGALSFGSTTFDTGTTLVRAVAVLGI